MSKVLCLYCGSEMLHVATKWSDAEWYECKDCHSRSPSANCMKVKEAALTRKDSPVVHARWDEDSVPFCNVCKACGAVVERHCVKANGSLNHCPNCGATMDGGAT